MIVINQSPSSFLYDNSLRVNFGYDKISSSVLVRYPPWHVLPMVSEIAAWCFCLLKLYLHCQH